MEDGGITLCCRLGERPPTSSHPPRLSSPLFLTPEFPLRSHVIWVDCVVVGPHRVNRLLALLLPHLALDLGLVVHFREEIEGRRGDNVLLGREIRRRRLVEDVK